MTRWTRTAWPFVDVNVDRRAVPGAGGSVGSQHPRTLLPVLVVVGALLALALLTVVIEREVVSAHEEVVAVSGPARAAVRDIQLHLALESARARGYLLTGDHAYVEGHQRARRDRQHAVAHLQVLVGRIDAPVQAPASRLAAELLPADAVLDSLFAGQFSRAGYTRRLASQQTRFERVTSIVHEIDGMLGRATEQRFAKMEVAHRGAMFAALALVVVAGLALALVARLGIAYRRLAERETAAHAASDIARAEAIRGRLEAERLSASRARLVRGFTHDVKNPLGAAAGFLALMQEGVLAPDIAAPKARRSISRALALIDELLQIERNRTGEVAVRRREFDLCEIALEAVNDWRPAATAKGLAMELDPMVADAIVASDPERVHQILGNFLSNAVRYTAAGTISVGVSAVTGKRVGDGELLRVAVCDTGPGLTVAQRGELFREFHRLDTAAGTVGSGLGLAISKRLAEALGGRIEVESEPGAGSTFALLLPRTSVPAFAEQSSGSLQHELATVGPPLR